MEDMKGMQRLAFLVNTILLACMALGFASFRYYGITYMVYHCIPTMALFAGLYYLIRKKKLYLVAMGAYIGLTAYMVAATLCMGYTAGFHLYCMSLIPLTFYMEYMAHRLQIPKMNAYVASSILVGVNLFSTGYTVLRGPVYAVGTEVQFRFMVVNAISVFGFLIGYSGVMLKLVMGSEQKLMDMAHTDRLTGLFNRHYMITHLGTLLQAVQPEQWIAMADIDDFKKINDTYGHSSGDYVLVELARLMQEVCPNCTISRWGGEEFLIICNGGAPGAEVMEQLRQRVEQNRFFHQGKEIKVTVTIGVAPYQAGQTLEKWIQTADARLYEGKNAQKNRVVYAS